MGVLTEDEQIKLYQHWGGAEGPLPAEVTDTLDQAEDGKAVRGSDTQLAPSGPLSQIQDSQRVGHPQDNLATYRAVLVGMSPGDPQWLRGRDGSGRPLNAAGTPDGEAAARETQRAQNIDQQAQAQYGGNLPWDNRRGQAMIMEANGQHINMPSRWKYGNRLG